MESFRRINNIAIVVIGLWALTFFFVTIFECGIHPEVQWTSPKTVQDMTCVDVARLLLCFAVTDVVTDFFVLTLPIREVWRLQMSTRKKYALTFIFGLGALSTAAGIVRLVLVVMASNGWYSQFRCASRFGHQTNARTTADFGASSDTLGKITPPFVWTNLEVSIGVIAASLPTLGPLWQAYRKTARTRGQSSDAHGMGSVAPARQRLRINYPNRWFHKVASGSWHGATPPHAEMLEKLREDGPTHDLKRLHSDDSLA